VLERALAAELSAAIFESVRSSALSDRSAVIRAASGACEMVITGPMLGAIARLRNGHARVSKVDQMAWRGEPA